MEATGLAVRHNIRRSRPPEVRSTDRRVGGGTKGDIGPRLSTTSGPPAGDPDRDHRRRHSVAWLAATQHDIPQPSGIRRAHTDTPSGEPGVLRGCTSAGAVPGSHGHLTRWRGGNSHGLSLAKGSFRPRGRFGRCRQIVQTDEKNRRQIFDAPVISPCCARVRHQTDNVAHGVGQTRCR